MDKIVSFIGKQNDAFKGLNARAALYAKENGLDYEWIPQRSYSKDQVILEMKKAQAAIIDLRPYGEDIFREVDKSIKIMVRFGVGYDAVDLGAARAHGIAIARTTGSNAIGVAEMALSLILSLRRQICYSNSLVRNGQWPDIICNELSGSTVGIVGFGAVGKKLCEYLKVLGCTVLAYDPYANTDDVRKTGAISSDLEHLFEASDVVSLHLALTSETRKMINSNLLNRMKKTAVLVNTSRGGVVDEEALYNCLKSKKILGAGLDVFETEPIAYDHILLGLDNVILTPHMSSKTTESFWNTYKSAIDIAVEYLKDGYSKHLLN